MPLILTVVGARPQFIKAAPVSQALRKARLDELLVHTGQHYDDNMSGIFFRDMGIPNPDINLNSGSGSHAYQTARMLTGLEDLMLMHRPDCVLVYGDTNSTLAGALAAVKLGIPVAHIEAGLRSYNRTMPEEHNRVLTDHSADLLFCPTQTAVDLLAREGLTDQVHFVGDTMYDALRQFSAVAREHSRILDTLNVTPGGYLLMTIHRPYNTDVPENMTAILNTLAECGETVIFPIHPRTHERLPNVRLAPSVRLINPVGYLDMLWLEQNARKILTDSGGIQKEAYLLGVPCITLRPETEWGETLRDGWNILTSADPNRIAAALEAPRPKTAPLPVFGDGHAAEQITAVLRTYLIGDNVRNR